MSSLLGALGLLAVLIVVIVVLNAFMKSRAGSAPVSRVADDLMRQAKTAQLVPIDADNIVRRANETFYWQQPAKLWEMRHQTHYEGGSAGISVRAMRGVYLRGSSYRGRPVTTEAMAPDDAGILYISNERFLFVGALGTKEIPFHRIGSIQPYSDGLRVDVLNETPMEFETGDGRLPVVFGRVLNGDLDAKPTPLADLSPDQIVAGATKALKSTSSLDGPNPPK